MELPFILTADASNTGLGAILSQYQDGEEVVICYASKTMGAAQRRYSVTEKECLAVVWATELFRPYLYGKVFTVITDHVALKWLLTFKGDNQRLLRWSLRLQEYQFDVQYRPGARQQHVDALSRIDLPENSQLGDADIFAFSAVPAEEMAGLQAKDPTIAVLMILVGKDGCPYFFRDNLLYRQWVNQGRRYDQLVVPYGKHGSPTYCKTWVN